MILTGMSYIHFNNDEIIHTYYKENISLVQEKQFARHSRGTKANGDTFVETFKYKPSVQYV